MIKSYRKELASIRENIFCIQNIQKDPSGAIHSFTSSVDQIIKSVFNDHLGKISEQACLVATGGYGRNELCPYSDIDLLVLHEGDHKEENIARCIRALWDMGFPLGCAVRSVAECRRILGEDLATDSSLLETRYLAGNRDLLLKLNQQVVHPYFVRKNQWFLSEMEASLRDGLFKSEQSLYMVEPDLKNGVCALRDCQRIIWAQKVALKKFSEPADVLLPFAQVGKDKFTSAYITLLSIRSALHMANAGRLDVLEFSFQNQVAKMLGLGSQSAGLLMELYFNTVRVVKIHLLIYLEHRKQKVNFVEKARRSLSAITIARKTKLLDGIIIWYGTPPPGGKAAALWIMNFFHLSLSYQATFSVGLENTLRTVSETLIPSDLHCEEIVLLFRKLLSTRAPIGTIIRRMHETGFLEKLLPEFQGLRCKVEYDSYHEFTVDQHTITAMCILDDLNQEKEDGIENIIVSAGNLFILRLAILLHDIGKSVSGEHATTGAMLALSICKRLHLSDQENELVLFLIKYHLELSRLTFQRMPEKHVFQAFGTKTGDRTHLDLLYILTVVDIKSVGRKTWTAWKGIQLYDTYSCVRDILNGNGIRSDREISFPNTSSTMLENVKQYDNIKSTKDLSVKVDRLSDFEQLTVCGIDRPHFFADIVGCLSSEGYNILSSSIITRDHLAIDTFQLEPDTMTSVSIEQRISNIEKNWQRMAVGEITAQKLIEKRLRHYPRKGNRNHPNRKPTVTINNFISREFTVIELRSPDRFALLYRIAKMLCEMRINIISAKLSTLVSLVNDVFYVTGPIGKKIEDPLLLEKIEIQLIEAVSDNKI